MSQHLSSTEVSSTPAKTPRESNIWWIARDWTMGATNPIIIYDMYSFEASPNMGVSFMASAIEISKISHLIIKAGKSLSYFNKILKFLLNISQLLNCHERKKKTRCQFCLFCLPCFVFNLWWHVMGASAASKREIPLCDDEMCQGRSTPYVGDGHPTFNREPL